MSKIHAVSEMNVEQRLARASALAALVENVVDVLPPRASEHDFSCDPEFFAGLSAVAALIREDVAAARVGIDFPTSQFATHPPSN